MFHPETWEVDRKPFAALSEWRHDFRGFAV